MVDEATLTTLVMLVVVLAGLLRGITGFGGSMLMMPPLSLLLGGAPAIVISLVLEVVAAVIMVPSTYRDVPFRRLALLAIPACLTVPIGSIVLTNLDPSMSRRLIGVAVVTFSLALLSGMRLSKQPAQTWQSATAAMGGVLLGATGIGAPPVILMLLSGPDSPKVSRAILTAFVGITSTFGLLATIAFSGHGALPLGFSVLLCGLYLGSTFVGMKTFHRLNDFGVKFIALSLMFTFGAITVFLG